ncbi:protein DMP2-like, partial [Andrographis paniculata]|uniref:protein DMP2-like n=1 Tax=Andrographis paniculata TaxID=175694 RepID=UPI0021E7C977
IAIPATSSISSGGTVFLFQYLLPVLTSNGECHVVHKYLSELLAVACGLSCFVSLFTDSYVNSQGDIGIVTTKGLWPGSDSKDLSSRRLRFGDIAHAILALSVFAVVALLHPDVVDCFYSDFKLKQKALLMAMPPVIVSGFVFVLFPNTRRGIRHPPTNQIGLYSIRVCKLCVLKLI